MELYSAIVQIFYYILCQNIYKFLTIMSKSFFFETLIRNASYGNHVITAIIWLNMRNGIYFGQFCLTSYTLCCHFVVFKL